jgi:AraC family transcriptional regulator
VPTSASMELQGRADLAPAGDVAILRAGAVWLRHQQSGPFAFAYKGEHPVLLFLFSAAGAKARKGGCTRGSFTLLVPGMTASFDTDEPHEVLALAYKDGAAGPGLGAPNLDLIDPAARQCAVDPGARAIAQEIRRVLLHEGEAAADYLESLARSLLVRAVQVLGAGRKAPARETLPPFSLRRVADHIDSRLGERITVAELAAVARLSRAHFSRAFQAATGETPHQFILSRRLSLVRRRLDEGAHDLSVLAARTGFSSHAHMTTAFRQAFGVTPRDHRDSHVSTALGAA